MSNVLEWITAMYIDVKTLIVTQYVVLNNSNIIQKVSAIYLIIQISMFFNCENGFSA